MNIKQLLNQNLVSWMNATRPEATIAISSRVRLARNIKGLPFPGKQNHEQGSQSLQYIEEAWKTSTNPLLRGFDFITMDQLSDLEKQILVEKHLISPGLVSGNSNRGLLFNEDASIVIMINEEDHLRIQCLLPGLQLQEACKISFRVDDSLEQKLDFAFDEKRGYLTSCPTNVGTGMRASVMLHLPATNLSGQIKPIFYNLAQVGMTVRGLYGEGTESAGNLFQLSNQVTLGQTEEEICNNLRTMSLQIINQEQLIREKLKSESPYRLEDKISRSYGILTNARLITSNEALDLLSDVRLGVDLGLIKNIKPLALNELIVAIRPAHLQREAGGEMKPLERDLKRAEIIREKLHVPTSEK